MDYISSMQIPVCNVFASNGFQIEHIPESLDDREFDNYSPHTHSFYEIIWFQEGKGRHVVDFSEYDVKPNTIFFLVPGQIHNFDHSQYKGVSIKMCVDFMNFDIIFHDFDSIPCFQIDEDAARALDKIVDAIEQESGNRQEFGNVDMLQSLIRMFLIQVYRHGIKENALKLDMLKPSHQLFVRFRTMVEKEYQHNHSVQEYAKNLHTNVRTLNSCVNECTGMSPLAFINSRILLEAKRLVRYSNMRIKEIAFTLGYDDPSYFVRMFKRNTHFMPTEFREADSIIQ